MSARGDAEAIHKAIAGWGTDDASLIELITSKNHGQLDAIWAEYQALYNKSVISDVAGDVSGNYGQLLTSLILRKGEYIAREIKNAVVGLGTDEKELIDVLAHAKPDDIILARQVYLETTKREAIDDVIGDTSGAFKKALVSLLKANRRDGNNPQADAEAIYQRGEALPKYDEEFFVEFFTTHTPHYIAAVDQAYTVQYGHSIVGSIVKETHGDFGKLLIALATPRDIYWARQIHDAIKGAGTNEKLLTRAFVINDHHQLAKVAQEYEKQYGRNLEKDIESETSFNYKKTLVSLLKHAHASH